MGVHRLLLVCVLVREAHIGDFLPVAGEGLDVASAVGLAVACPRLQVAEKPFGDFKGLLGGCSPAILAQSVDGEADGVRLLLGVERSPGGIDRPVDTPHLPVEEMVAQVLICAGGGCEILRVANDAVCGRECPEQAAIEYRPLGGIIVGGVIAVDTAEESAARIGHAVGPERQYVACQVLAEV